MATENGTASNLEDLFTKALAFLTTNADLVAASQEWEVLRVRRDNLLSCTTNLGDSVTVGERKVIQTCRYDGRSLNVDAQDSRLANYFSSTFASGVSHVTFQLREARAVASVVIRASSVSASFDGAGAVKGFRLQYSDNGSAWTTALTVAGAPSPSLGQRVTFAVPGTPGSHEYWRLLFDANQGGGSYLSWRELLLLEADGTVANHFGSEAILKATGTAGTDAIYMGLRTEYDTAAGWFNLFLNGYTGYNPNEASWFSQPGALPGATAQYPLAVPMVPCWDTSMAYWFAASGRSFRLAVKVSTNFEGAYLGFILPYCTPNQYSYPLAVGGSLVPSTTDRSAAWRYSTASARHGVFPGPGGNSPNSLGNQGVWTTLYLRSPDGEWMNFGNRPSSGLDLEASILGPSIQSNFTATGNRRSIWPHCVNDQWTSGRLPYRDCLGGGYVVQPCVFLQIEPFREVFGELEGVYNISGYLNAAENTFEYNGKTHVVFQNAYRNAVHELWAMETE